jgi:hypothetical protein
MGDIAVSYHRSTTVASVRRLRVTQQTAMPAPRSRVNYQMTRFLICRACHSRGKMMS